ncbi:UDP-N-acetylglucosamine transferase subunit ALG13 homolog [Phymastichus coffea]|uniref:UDP-N-acetylglucosamine transferase subunit ALG13 homolog n=1 Tax=Phymastichus coffea TaxID=108790 RepID=UPI00273C254E|nr:UDP-N-acetylglucosamine transferase subunit ALG13 homolog [Phymastichus coffea]
MSNKKIFVTVGTTKFDNLINTITSDELLKELCKKGYNQLILQIGKTDLKPDCTPRLGFNHIEAFDLSPSLNEAMKSADLVISHAGAGSCLEALELCKPLIIVTNDLLMNNHQSELAEQLYKDGYLYYSNCKDLCELVQKMDLTKLIPFKDNKSQKIANVIDVIMGFS